MPPAGAPNDFTPSVRRMIAAMSRRLVGSHGLRPQDRPDVEQELAARLVPRLSDHDPARSSLEGFAAMLLRQTVTNLLRDRRAGKRSSPGPRTPPDEVSDPGADADARHRQLAQDVAAVLDALPADLRELARALMTSSVSQVARRTGVRRTTLYGRLRELRVAFERAGLRDYA